MFKDCLRARKQRAITAHCNEEREADAGVPQGAVVRLNAFSLVTSDLGKRMNSERMDESL